MSNLEDRIAARTARVGVVGLGSVGLPLAAIFARGGFPVIGCDTDDAKLRAIDGGVSPLRHVADEVVRELRASDGFETTGDLDRLAAADVVVLCLPTPLGPALEPDLSILESVAHELAPILRPGALVVLESTTYPGTTRAVLGAIFAESGLAPGTEFLLAFSPERQDPGRGDPTDTEVPKLVGGTCERSAELAEKLYSSVFTDVRCVSSAEVAESAKLLENVFRAVNIALVNELKIAFDAMGIDVWEVIDAAATKPFGYMKFTPGPGMGGHCIPIDPFYLSWAARRAGGEVRFVELAGEINRHMPHYVFERTRRALGQQRKGIEGARILLLGLAYKPDVDIVSESPTLFLFELFETAGAEVRYSDPYLPEGPRTDRIDLSHHASLELSEAALAQFDAVVLATDHAAFDYDLIARAAPLVVDTRNALASRMSGRPHYFKA